MTKNQMIVLVAVFVSFTALGFPDGTFGVAWPFIRYEMRLGLDMAFFVVVSHSVFYSLASGLMGRMARLIKLPYVNMLGLVLMAVGVSGFSFAPNLYFLMLVTMVTGFGMGLIDSGLNAYAAKYFSVRHMNWLHCFWGLGASISPVIMTNMVMYLGWRTGYITIAALQGIMALFVLATLLKGAWIMNGDRAEEASGSAEHVHFLRKKRFAVMQVVIFIFYAGFEYSVTFWTPSVMLEARGLGIDRAGLFPAVYLGAMTAGRFFMGYISHKFANITMVRFGLIFSACGLVLLMFTNSFVGMAMVGFGFGPVFPCLMHETAHRFGEKATTKLVGYQVAAVGVGVGFSTFGMGYLLEGVSLNALFPAVITGVVIVFLINETIEGALRKVKNNG